MAKLLISVTSAAQAEQAQTLVQAGGGELLASYPNSLLVRCTDAQWPSLQSSLQGVGLELTLLERPRLRLLGASFALEDAIAAEREVPVAIATNRLAYYLVELIGPPKGDWLQGIEAQGGRIHSTLDDFTLVVGLRPERLDAVLEQSWVETITPYRPAMKLSPQLRPELGRQLGTRELRSPDLGFDADSSPSNPPPLNLNPVEVDPEDPDLLPSESRSRRDAESAAEPDVNGETDETAAEIQEQVEVSVFAGEDIGAIASQITALGGTVLGRTPQAVKALVPRRTIPRLANEQSVQSIQPTTLPEWFNSQATAIMGAPANRTLSRPAPPSPVPDPKPQADSQISITLKGTGQIVAVADSGLDTGDPATLHPDLQGRIVGITSWPPNPAFNPYRLDPPNTDDGPADFYSGHGTHVAGSVLGNGAAAQAAGLSDLSQGMAPEARLYFQAIEQKINWKSRSQLRASGLQPFIPSWPPPAASLWGLPEDISALFQAAYDAGARIHTNSWGANTAGQYTDDSRTVDQFLWTHRDMVILFAAGNSGVDRNGAILPDSIGSPATAKNCVTVGASENNRPAGSLPKPGIDANWSALRWKSLTAAGHVSDNPEGMAAFSSRGPTDDNRIKPDVVAPGTNILSLRTTVYRESGSILWGDLASDDPRFGKYCWSGGTSMSTPLVAGTVALIRQYLTEHRHLVQSPAVGGNPAPVLQPSGALLKALLVNGAVTMVGQYPSEIPGSPDPAVGATVNRSNQNPVSGFGRVHLERTLDPDLWIMDDPSEAIATGQQRSYDLRIAPDTPSLSVTLAWTDAPGAVGIGQVQNRLYLQLQTPDGSVIDGDLSPWPTVTNNVQRIVLPSPSPGTYQLRVRGVSVTQMAPSVAALGTPPTSDPRQDFAIAASPVSRPPKPEPVEPTPTPPPVEPPPVEPTPTPPPVEPPPVEPTPTPPPVEPIPTPPPVEPTPTPPPTPPTPTLSLGDIHSRPAQRLWTPTILSAQVLISQAGTSRPATPQDGISVRMSLTQGDRPDDRTIDLGRASYDASTQRFIQFLWGTRLRGGPQTSQLLVQVSQSAATGSSTLVEGRQTVQV